MTFTLSLWKVIPDEETKSIRAKLEAQATVIRQFALIILGAGINFSVGLGLILSSLTQLQTSPAQSLGPSPIPTQTTILAASYFIIGLVYSVVASLSFRPKRIVQPLYVQAVTASFTPILIVALAFLRGQLDLLSVSVASFAFFLLALAIFGVAGLGQMFIVRYLVGLNGSKQDTRWSSLLLTAKLEDVLKVLRSDEVTTALRLVLQRERGGKYAILRTISNAFEQFFLIAMQDPQNSNQTQLATVSFRQELLRGITASPSTLLEQMRAKTLIGVLQNAGIVFRDGDASEALFEVYAHALEPTQAKILIFRSYPPHVKAITIGVLSLFGIFSGLWYFGLIKQDLFETFVLFATLSLIFEFLPLLRKNPVSETD